MGGVSLRLCVCEYTHKPPIWQDEHLDADHRSRRWSARVPRWTSASSPPSWRSPTTGRSRQLLEPCSRCSRTSPATSPGWRRSSARELVDRAHGGLTDDGARVVERARRVLRELDEIAAEIAQRDGDVVGDVRLGMLGTTARWLLPRLLAEMSARHPQVRVIVAEGSTSVLIPGAAVGTVRRGGRPPPSRRAGAEHRAAVRRGPPPPRRRRSPARRPLVDPPRRARRLPPAPPPARIRPPPGPRPRRPVGRRPARGRSRGRRCPPAGHPRRRRPRRGDRPGDRRSRTARATSPRSTCRSCRPESSPSRRTAGPARAARSRRCSTCSVPPCRRGRWSRQGSGSDPTPSRSSGQPGRPTTVEQR